MKKKSILLVGIGLILLGSVSNALAIPKKVILIRHGEKIHQRDNKQVENLLNVKGEERAAALAYYFSGTPLYNTPPLTHIFAPALEGPEASVRPIQTCTPTANRYKIPLTLAFNHTQTQELAQELLTNPKYNDTTILICWSHGHIKPIVMALGGEDPGEWPSNIYDQVYMLTYEAGNPKPQLQKIPQKLMFGDRATLP